MLFGWCFDRWGCCRPQRRINQVIVNNDWRCSRLLPLLDRRHIIFRREKNQSIPPFQLDSTDVFRESDGTKKLADKSYLIAKNGTRGHVSH